LAGRMSSSFELQSHPDRLLMDHLQKVGELSKSIVNSKCISDEFFGGERFLSEIAYLIGIAHDFGKATREFQRMLKGGEKTKYARHGFLSSLVGYYLVEKFLKETNKLQVLPHLPTIAWMVINKHHGNMKDILGTYGEISKFEDQRDTVKQQMESISDFSYDEVKRIFSRLFPELDVVSEFFKEFSENVGFVEEIGKKVRNSIREVWEEKTKEYYYLALLFYSVLLDSDKLDASGTKPPLRTEKIPVGLADEYKGKLKGEYSAINELRNTAYEEVSKLTRELNLQQNRILSLNLPTGMGKTLMGLSCALTLRKRVSEELGFFPKIIYSLPFLSIIDQNSKVIKNILAPLYEDEEVPSTMFLKHHHLAEVGYKVKGNNGELNLLDLNKSLLLTEGWHSEIVITTFVQFFQSLITHRNRAARKFHNMINSIIILDEIQSIPHRYWCLANEVLRDLARKFNCWIILMTATEPWVFREEGVEDLVKERNKYFQAFDRVKYDFDLQEKSFSEFKTEIRSLVANSKENIMVVLNTIDSCKELYLALKEELLGRYSLSSKECLDEDGICQFPDLELINLSTQVLPDYRLRRIERIKRDEKRKVIITTQLIEAGVDISVDQIFRDLAPLDCVIQTAGRCNRNCGEKKGRVNVIVLKGDGGKCFHQYIYDPLLIDATEEVIDKFGEKNTEKGFNLSAASNYFHAVEERGSNQKSREIIEAVEKLNFSEIAQFKLIEEKRPVVSIFVEIDENAKKVREKITRILLEEKGFRKAEELLKLKREINSYTIPVRLGKKMEEEIIFLPNLGGTDDWKYIPNEKLDMWYKRDIGFEPSEDIDRQMRII
jgi:CRISPR-associated endonuclease/helicase Cas3